MSVRIFVGNLPYSVREEELREHFSAAGSVINVILPTDRETGRQRGFAFIDFNDRTQAEEAIRRFNNQSFKGRSLAVKEALAKEARPQSATAPRSLSPQPTTTEAGSSSDAPPTVGGKPARGFGPDAEPYRRRSKNKGMPRSERAPKGPMREMVTGQFRSGDDDYDDYDDDDELTGEEGMDQSNAEDDEANN